MKVSIEIHVFIFAWDSLQRFQNMGFFISLETREFSAFYETTLPWRNERGGSGWWGTRTAFAECTHTPASIKQIGVTAHSQVVTASIGNFVVIPLKTENWNCIRNTKAKVSIIINISCIQKKRSIPNVFFFFLEFRFVQYSFPWSQKGIFLFLSAVLLIANQDR